jgi:uncharacterized protein with NRDE domain
LLVLAWRCHPRYRLVLAANRDEFHARPAAPLAPWDDAPGIIGGRDLQAGGAWLAVDRGGRVGVVTNFREFGRRRRSAPSRGGLIPAYLSGDRAPAAYFQSLETDAPGYAGFNLLLADAGSLWYGCNRADVFARELAPGIYGLSNEFLDTPWPKLVRVRARFRALLDSADGTDTRALSTGLFGMLADREPAPPDEVPPGDLSPEWARTLSSPFVLDPTYGTRCSTVLTISDGGTLVITERRFGADGTQTSEAERALNVGP